MDAKRNKIMVLLQKEYHKFPPTARKVANLILKMPNVCKLCEQEMVRVLEQNEEGDWGVRWLCNCEVDENTIRMIESEIAKEEISVPVIDVLEDIEEHKDCDCRDCKPELWILDTDRDIWIKKAKKIET